MRDFNVPFEGSRITDDRRIAQADDQKRAGSRWPPDPHVAPGPLIISRASRVQFADLCRCPASPRRVSLKHVFAGFSADAYRGFMEQCSGDRRRVEAVMNHRHVFDYFSQAGGSATAAQILYFGRVLKDMWQAKLCRDFPGRRFIVSFSEGPYDDLAEYEVTFRQAI
jgi:hypothetical protein